MCPHAEMGREPETEVGVRRSSDVELVGCRSEDRTVAIGRGIEHGDHLARFDRLTVDHHGRDARAAHVDDRRGPAGDLFDCTIPQGVISRRSGQLLPQGRALGQRDHPVRDVVAGGFVAGDEEQQDVGEELLRCHLACCGGLRQCGEEVVAWIDHSIGRQGLHIAGHGGRGGNATFESARVLRVFGADDGVRPFEDLGVVL